MLGVPLSFHLGPRPPRPKDVSPADWVLAVDGLYVKLVPTAAEFPAGLPATLDIVVRNVDTVPHTIPMPATPYGENRLLTFTICSERERWTELAGTPSDAGEMRRLLECKRRPPVSAPPPGYGYSSALRDGTAFAFVSETGTLSCGDGSSVNIWMPCGFPFTSRSRRSMSRVRA